MVLLTKTTAKVAGEFALGTVTGIMSHMGLADMQQRVVTAIVSVIEEAFFTKINGTFHSKLVALAAQESNPDTFHTRCQEIKQKIHMTHGSLLSQVFDQLHSQVVLSLNDTYNKMANDLSKSKMAVGTGEKVAIMVDKASSVVQKRLKFANAVSTLVQLVDIEERSSTTQVQDVDKSIVEYELNDIKQYLKETIKKHFQQKLTSASENMIKGSLRKIASAGKLCAKAGVQNAFNGRTSSQVVRDLQLKRRRKIYDVQTHGTIPISSGSTTPSRPRTQAQKKQQAYEVKRERFQHTVIKPKHIVMYAKMSRALQLLGSSKLLKDPYNHSTSVCQFKSQWFLNFSIVEKDVGAAETRHKMLLDTSVTETMKPTLPKLLQFQVPRKVGPKYYDFGIILLNDEDGTHLNCIEFDCGRDCEKIVRTILSTWLEGDGKPVTWSALIETLRSFNIDNLDKLADKIHTDLQ